MSLFEVNILINKKRPARAEVVVEVVVVVIVHVS